MRRLELEFRELDHQHCFKWPFGTVGICLFSKRFLRTPYLTCEGDKSRPW